MSDHYYTQQPMATHDRRNILFEHAGVQLHLISDAGVFSRDAVDPGTRLLIASVQPPASGRILDLGCGYGPIGICYAVRCPQCEIHLSDVNTRATALSAENAARNGAHNVIVHNGEGFSALSGLFFDLIVTNPPIRAGRTVLLDLFAGARDHLEPGGRFACVVRTQQGAKTLAREIERIFGHVEEIARGGGYRVYEATSAGRNKLVEKPV